MDAALRRHTPSPGAYEVAKIMMYRTIKETQVEHLARRTSIVQSRTHPEEAIRSSGTSGRCAILHRSALPPCTRGHPRKVREGVAEGRGARVAEKDGDLGDATIPVLEESARALHPQLARICAHALSHLAPERVAEPRPAHVEPARERVDGRWCVTLLDRSRQEPPRVTHQRAIVLAGVPPVCRQRRHEGGDGREKPERPTGAERRTRGYVGERMACV